MLNAVLVICLVCILLANNTLKNPQKANFQEDKETSQWRVSSSIADVPNEFKWRNIQVKKQKT